MIFSASLSSSQSPPGLIIHLTAGATVTVTVLLRGTVSPYADLHPCTASLSSGFRSRSTSYSPARLMLSQIQLASRGGNIHRSHIAQGHSTVRRVAPSTTCSSAAVPVGSEAVSASDRHPLENPPRSAHPSYQPTTFRRTPFVRFCGALQRV